MSSGPKKDFLSTDLRSTIINEEQAKNLPLGHDVKYNSSGFRCDEFKTKHDFPHFLFVGCSITFGDAIPVESGWAYITHEYLKNTYGSSGFYNISGLGNSIGDCVTNVTKYIDVYGKPDAIFFGVPDPNRLPVDINGKQAVITITDKNDNKKLFLSIHEELSLNPLLKISFDYYLLLHFFCKINNIKLFATQIGPLYDYDFYNALSKKFNSFVLTNEDEYLHFLRSTEKGKDQYYLKGSDGMHPGTGSHLYWSKLFIERIKNEKIFNE
jgi:hypothetical protein